MKKLLSVFGFLFLTCFSAVAQHNFSFVGATTNYYPVTGHFILTPASGGPCGNNIAGAAWSNQTVDFTHDFTIKYQVLIHNITPHQSQADGHTIVFGSNLTTTSINGGAGALGYYNIGPVNTDFNNSIAIEFDLHDNSYYPQMNDIAYAHTMAVRNGSPHNPNVISDKRYGPVPLALDMPSFSLETDRYIDYEIIWDCETQDLWVLYDNQLKLWLDINPAAEFSNPTSVSWGFTAGRGLGCCEFKYRDIVLQYDNQCEGCVDGEIDLYLESCYNGNASNPLPYYKLNFHGSVPNIPPGFNITQFVWDLGDGTIFIETNPLVTPMIWIHKYYTFGPKTITLTIHGTGENGEPCTQVVTLQILIPDCNLHEIGDDDGPFDPPGGNSVNGQGKPGKNTNSTGLPDVGLDNALQLYPNPVTDKLTIVSNDSKIAKVLILDMTGKTVITYEGNNTDNVTINMQTLTAGVYGVLVVDKDGTTERNKVVLVK